MEAAAIMKLTILNIIIIELNNNVLSSYSLGDISSESNIFLLHTIRDGLALHFDYISQHKSCLDISIYKNKLLNLINSSNTATNEGRTEIEHHGNKSE